MANITPEELAEALAAVIEAVKGAGIVVTEKRFAQSNEELIPLLINQSENGTLNGWQPTWNELPEQADEGSCQIITVYRFFMPYLFGYLNDEFDPKTSEVQFKANIFAVNEALNASRDLGFDKDASARNLVRHNCLYSVGAFDLIDYARNGVNRLAHIAPLGIDITVTNSYKDENEE